jgi:hypothetical protein
MRLARRVARLERHMKAVVADDFPTCIAYIPYNGRGDVPPGGISFRSGPALVVIYDPACPPKELSETRPGRRALPSSECHGSVS